MCLMPLIGMTGMTKKSVMKLMPFLSWKLATVPQRPQRICCGVSPEPHVKKCVPMMKKQFMLASCCLTLCLALTLRRPRLLRCVLTTRCSLRCARFRTRLFELIERGTTGEARGRAQVCFDAQELIVLGDAVGARERAGLDLAGVGRNREVCN